MHFTGISRLLEASNSNFLATAPLTHSIPILEVIGLIDIPAFVIGRRHPSQRIWLRYRSGSLGSSTARASADSIEPVSGLPKTLLDLFASGPEQLVEEELWLWPGYPGSSLQCQLWESYRCAGILDARLRSSRHIADHASSPVDVSTSAQDPTYNRRTPLLTDEILMARCLSSLDSIHTAVAGSTALSRADSFVVHSMSYPLFVTSLYFYSLRRDVPQDPSCQILGNCFDYLRTIHRSVNLKNMEELVIELASREISSPWITPDSLAYDKQQEIALF